MKPVYPFRRTCKEITALLIAREDRDLPLSDRLALRLHMAMCQACPRFERQLLTMRNAMKQWRSYAEAVEGTGKEKD
ncbi:zf-HC2 domain-containing protein [Hydrogenophaga sp.]|uniref:zf-HC2 domain-containing protein n=1 Tax=Hydrogenophaga sp. TaxID=1904254 RepID=UPI0027224BC1|nr:zf-HC2 domain-containing protein [Hydrogenophaga sp.]MDO8905370.1 zf-HC2 domain-containing protein [Hydrogenophaga sp.]